MQVEEIRITILNKYAKLERSAQEARFRESMKKVVHNLSGAQFTPTADLKNFVMFSLSRFIVPF